MDLEIQVVVRMYVATVLMYRKSVDAGIEYLIRILVT